jgi:aminoglycoside phosphotransferase (APT) family kinase protein
VANVNVQYSPSENSYKSMKRLRDLSVDIPSLVIQKPLATLPEVNALVMEWVNGTNLTDIMQYSTRFSSEKEKKLLENSFENLGRTMELVHSRTLAVDANSSEFSNNLSLNMNHIENLLKNSLLKNSKLIKQAFIFLRNTPLQDLTTTWVHGDLSPTNVIITRDNKILIIDFEHSRFDSPYFDLGSFVVRSKIYFGHNPIRYSINYNNNLINKFLTGYFSLPNHKFSKEMLRYYEIFDLLQFVLNHVFSNQDYFSIQNLIALFLLRSLKAS